ncbi:hypothetical protein CYLTODRAFT_494610 [Cylindrobasidium torrendii FP15055 ss-10]|uniref:Uncharacterized protein n=1 Tax=Cylindrobasidium torrendii FP15055 ss-10 TaxID=1314674 RepID=A0A0D7AX87_9AGAR|nr:hypothetical protein CYLTODRAFT_494610 [Cylindrobasidium torrendii FP15055 ss-10]
MHSETLPADTQHTAILKIWQALYKERNLPPEKAPQELDQRYFRPILKYSYENYDEDEPFNCNILLLERKSDRPFVEPTIHFKLDCDSELVHDNFLGEDFRLPQYPVGIHYHIRKVQAYMSRHYRDMRQNFHQRLPEREAKVTRIETFRKKVAEQTTIEQSAIDGAPDDKCPGQPAPPTLSTRPRSAGITTRRYIVSLVSATTGPTPPFSVARLTAVTNGRAKNVQSGATVLRRRGKILASHILSVHLATSVSQRPGTGFAAQAAWIPMGPSAPTALPLLVRSNVPLSQHTLL